MFKITSGYNSKDDDPHAVIYPIPKEYVDRVLEKEKITFVKYNTHEVISDNLLSCKKLLFYKSRGNRCVVGEGTITDLNLLNIDEIINNYRNSLFLSEDELKSYSDGRNKKPVVFNLKNTKKYPKCISLNKPITMSGMYINKNQYKRITKHRDRDNKCLES